MHSRIIFHLKPAFLWCWYCPIMNWCRIIIDTLLKLDYTYFHIISQHPKNNNKIVYHIRRTSQGADKQSLTCKQFRIWLISICFNLKKLSVSLCSRLQYLLCIGKPYCCTISWVQCFRCHVKRECGIMSDLQVIGSPALSLCAFLYERCAVSFKKWLHHLFLHSKQDVTGGDWTTWKSIVFKCRRLAGQPRILEMHHKSSCVKIKP